MTPQLQEQLLPYLTLAASGGSGSNSSYILPGGFGDISGIPTVKMVFESWLRSLRSVATIWPKRWLSNRTAGCGSLL
ncbi:MAG: hypothetical protein KZQ79_05190, partial [Candidatus Thiodiazotropha sp. (ex Lucinoma borealis)]|nr:hypothetical protein [Candidatus Thiodiazotropha sp. (ex Lucinoma borealis)]